MTKRTVVLVSDPVPATGELLRAIFEDAFAAHVVTLDGPGAALLMAREVRPDLIILELDARRELDFDLMRRLKQDELGASIPVLAMTAWGQQLTCEEALAAGASDCVAKPFQLDDLIGRAAALMGRAVS
jgi:two-component system phosphate regulon response regulator PhoB